MAKAINRVGYGPLSGGLNPRILFSETAPVSPKRYDIWINTLTQSKSYWTGTEWKVVGG